MINIIKMAYRDLGRNRRRSFFSALALGIGLMCLLFMAGVIAWELNSSMEKSIELQTGHLQVRASSYDINKTSLAYEDLIEKPGAVAAQIAALSPVKVVTPRLYASGIVVSGDQSLGVRVTGIDPASPANAPFQNGIVSGQFLTADDTGGILIGQTLADKMGIKTGDQISLMINTSNGDVVEQPFTIRGIYTTHTPAYDQVVAFLPLTKAQTITNSGDRASVLFILLNDINQTKRVAVAIQGSQYKVDTYEQLNVLLVQFNDYANALLLVLYLIVLAITATVIVNTLIMAVFERTREIGILSAIGMKGGPIMAMFFAESSMLAAGGILIGLVLGLLVTFLVGTYGVPIGNLGITGFLLGDRIYAQFNLSSTISLVITAFVVTLLASLYPALLAARMEPVEALRSGI